MPFVYDSTKCKLLYNDRKQISGYGGGGTGLRSGQEGVGSMITKGHKENLGGDEYVRYINYGVVAR